MNATELNNQEFTEFDVDAMIADLEGRAEIGSVREKLDYAAGMEAAEKHIRAFPGDMSEHEEVLGTRAYELGYHATRSAWLRAQCA